MREKNSKKTRRDIVIAAKKVFLKNGYINTTISQISAEAEVGYGTVYSHFKAGKDEVLNRVADDIFEELFAIAIAEYNVQSIEELRITLEQQIIKALDIADKNRPILKLIWEAMGKSVLVCNHWAQIQDKFIDKTMQDITKNIKKGFAKQINERIVAIAIMHMIWGFLWDYVFEKYGRPNDIAKTIATIYTEGVYHKHLSG